jgi:hypothetical protein
LRQLLRRSDLVASEVIVLQNSEVAGLRISLENAKRETIADSYNLNRVSEVACEFKVRRWGPLTFLHENRARSPQNFWPSVQNDICNTIEVKADIARAM